MGAGKHWQPAELQEQTPRPAAMPRLLGPSFTMWLLISSLTGGDEEKEAFSEGGGEVVFWWGVERVYKWSR